MNIKLNRKKKKLKMKRKKISLIANNQTLEKEKNH